MTARALWPVRRIHMPAFFAALLLAPFIGSIAFCWLIIPVLALVAGLPVYFVVATPLLLWYLGGGRRSGGDVAMLAAAANVALFLPVYAVAVFTDDRDLATFAQIYAGCGALTGLVWGGMFGWLYNRLTRPRATKVTA